MVLEWCPQELRIQGLPFTLCPSLGLPVHLLQPLATSYLPYSHLSHDLATIATTRCHLSPRCARFPQLPHAWSDPIVVQLLHFLQLSRYASLLMCHILMTQLLESSKSAWQKKKNRGVDLSIGPNS
jgi:hypothetical protein